MRRFLDSVITTDETWLTYFDPESKRQSVFCEIASSSPPKKVKVMRSVKKVISNVFADRRGVMLQHAVGNARL